MNDLLVPDSLELLVEAVRSAPRVLPVGGRTKPRLSTVDAVKISTTKLSGISEYDSSEFTFTAGAGTPVREIAVALEKCGQYLPFDPMLLDAGTTLGGTVAAGLSGPGRFRFGGLRDFILGVRFVDGEGRVLRMGGKVVKNAAGFDLPKFFVGSLGRFGVLAEITFKVFPRPAATRTLRLAADSWDQAQRIFTEAATSRFEFDALDAPPGETGILARLAGPQDALDPLCRAVFARWPGQNLAHEDAARIWHQLGEFHWCPPEAPLVKVPISPASLPAVVEGVKDLGGARLHLSAGGNVAYIALAGEEQTVQLDARLRALRLCALTLRGDGPLWLGQRASLGIIASVKQALDPVDRFPPLEY